MPDPPISLNFNKTVIARCAAILREAAIVSGRDEPADKQIGRAQDIAEKVHESVQTQGELG